MIEEGLNKLWDKLEGWGTTIVAMLPNFVLALLVLVLFYIAAKMIKKGTNKLLKKTYNNHELREILTKIVFIAVIVVGCMTALNILKLDQTVASIFAGAGIIGLALAFAFQDMAANFVSGFAMAAKGPFEVGQVVEIDGINGTVQAINLRTTELATFDGNIVIIPNRKVYQNNIINFQSTHKRRVDIEVGVSYGDDLRKAKETAIQAVKEVPVILIEDGVTLFYNGFGDSSVNFTIRFWVRFDEQQDFLEGKSEAIIKIKEAFDTEGLSIPFPIRTLDFGIRGGEKLNEVINFEEGNAKKVPE